MKGIVLFTCWAAASMLSAQNKTIAYQELPPAGSGMFVAAEMDQDSIWIQFSGPDDRWIALGLGNGMAPTDVLVYSEGKMGASHAQDWRDYFNSNQLISGVNEDASQDWIVDSSVVANGQRTVYVKRPLNTGDNADTDVSFSDGSLNLVWARGASSSFVLSNHGTNNRRPGISLAWTTQSALFEEIPGIVWTQKGRRILLSVAPNQAFQALVTDVQGRVLYQTRQATEIRLEEFPSGIYVLQLHMNGLSSAAKFALD